MNYKLFGVAGAAIASIFAITYLQDDSDNDDADSDSDSDSNSDSETESDSENESSETKKSTKKTKKYSEQHVDVNDMKVDERTSVTSTPEPRRKKNTTRTRRNGKQAKTRAKRSKI